MKVLFICVRVEVFSCEDISYVGDHVEYVNVGRMTNGVFTF